MKAGRLVRWGITWGLMAVLATGIGAPAGARTPASQRGEATRETRPRVTLPGGMMPVVGRNLTHVVKPGEDLYTLGLHYGLAIEHLMWANGLASEKVPVGRKLVIPLMRVVPQSLEQGLVINLPERGVFLYKNHEVIGFYPCAIGMGGRFATPTGDATIVNRQVDPTWNPPDWADTKEPVPPGPNNPLGDRWIGLSLPGVGLHGTNQPMSVGQNASHGCMRMYPHMVRKLFEQVRVGMPARVVYEPVKVGFSPEDRKVYVQVFPDVYGRQPDALGVLRERLASCGLEDFVDEDGLRRVLAQKNGLPQKLLGDDIVIKVNGRKVAPAFSPFIRNGQIWTSSDVVRAIGGQASFSHDDKDLVITRDAEEVWFRSDESAEPPDDPGVKVLSYRPRIWNGKSIIPLKPMLEAFNLTFKWDAPHKTLLIFCPDMDARL